MYEQLISTLNSIPAPVVFALALFEIVVKGIALWRSSRSGKQYWFIALLVVNSLGILPLIYLAFFDKRKASIDNIEKKGKTSKK